MRIVALAALLVALAGCQTTEYASGPIQMTGAVLNTYMRYKQLPAPEFFAVSKDGKSAGASYCDGGGACAGNGTYIALQMCEQYAKGSPCVIYARGGKPVFDGPDLLDTKPADPAAQTKTAPRAAANSAAPVTMPRATADRLRELQSLLDQRLITQPEFDARRRAILDTL